MIAPKNAAPLPPSYLAMTGNIGTQTSGIEPISYSPTWPLAITGTLPPRPPVTPIKPPPDVTEDPGEGTLEPPIWNPPGGPMPPGPNLEEYLNSLRDTWHQEYRGMGNTPTSWYDWAMSGKLPGVLDWYNLNTPVTPFGANNMMVDPTGIFSNWLKKNMVNYTNPIRLPQPNRMQQPVTDWTRLAGPDQGISSGFSERATASPWSADYRGGAYGATGRTPSWTQIGK
jgi:hypothetical protein